MLSLSPEALERFKKW